MDLVIESSGDAIRFRVLGDVIAETGADLRLSVQEAATKGVRQIVLDFSHVPCIDSTGLGILLGLRRSLRNKGVALVIENPSSGVAETLHLMRLAPLFGLSAGEG